MADLSKLNDATIVGLVGPNAIQAVVDTNGNQLVNGSVASLATDVGNPIKVGAVYNATLPAPTTGQRVDLQVNKMGELDVATRNTYKHLTGNGTTVVKSGFGRLHAIVINNNATGGTITIYDGTSTSGAVVGVMTIATPVGGLLTTSGLPPPSFIGPFHMEFTTGLTVVLAGSTTNDVTVIYQ